MRQESEQDCEGQEALVFVSFLENILFELHRTYLLD